MALPVLLLVSIPAASFDFFDPFNRLLGRDELVIWRAPGQFVKVVDQERLKGNRRPPKNEHPAQISPAALATVLASLSVRRSKGAMATDKGVPLFTPAEVSLLSTHIADALGKANQQQDIVYAVVDVHENLGGAARLSTAGRVFVHEGRLNFIFGNALERTDEVDDNISHFAVPHRAGKRREVVDNSLRILGNAEIAYQSTSGG
ncbi:MAG: hypothetical protein ACREUU_09815, partial [Gammaproteobacteria bacterium]